MVIRFIQHKREEYEKLKIEFNNSSRKKREKYRCLISSLICDDVYHAFEFADFIFTEEDKKIIWQSILMNNILIHNHDIYPVFACSDKINFALYYTSFSKYYYDNKFWNLYELFCTLNWTCTEKKYKQFAATIYNHLDQILPMSRLRDYNNSLINKIEYCRHEKRCVKLRQVFRRYFHKHHYLIILINLTSCDIAWHILNILA